VKIYKLKINFMGKKRIYLKFFFHLDNFFFLINKVNNLNFLNRPNFYLGVENEPHNYILFFSSFF
jgi:hypothetical protein